MGQLAPVAHPPGAKAGDRPSSGAGWGPLLAASHATGEPALRLAPTRAGARPPRRRTPLARTPPRLHFDPPFRNLPPGRRSEVMARLPDTG